MANPQPEQFTRISNELYTAIMQTDFSKRQRKILDLVIRMSYGCGKKHALLRPLDFELVGIYKTDIRRELKQLTQYQVLLVQGDQVYLNKDYDLWRVEVNRTFAQERWQEVLARNLAEVKASRSKTPTAESVSVSELLTNTSSSVSEIPLKGKRFTSGPGSETLTPGAPQTRQNQPWDQPKEKVKDNSKDILKPPGPANTLAILSQFPRYSNRQTELIRCYWQSISQTRSTGAIAPSIIAKQMTYWENYPAGIVEQALEIHLAKYPSKREEYTTGIMRRLAQEELCKGGSSSGTIRATAGTHEIEHRPSRFAHLLS